MSDDEPIWLQPYRSEEEIDDKLITCVGWGSEFIIFGQHIVPDGEITVD